MSMIDHPSYTHSLRPEVIERRSGQAGSHTADTDDRPRNEPTDRHVLIARPWWDPDLAIHGHPLDDPYVEMFWTGVLGPSVTCLLRRLARGFQKHPNGFRMSAPDTARALGLGTGTGRNGPLNRTIDRACTFHLVRRTGPEEIDVRLHLPTLSRRQLSRLPVSVRNTHREWLSDRTGEHLGRHTIADVPDRPSGTLHGSAA